MKMRKILEKRAAALKAKLKGLEERSKDTETTGEELTEIEEQVVEITSELDEISDAISELTEDETAELEETVTDLEDKVEEIVEEVDEPSTEESADETAATAEQRSKISTIIGKAVSSRGESMKKKLNQRSAFLKFLAGRINENQARSLGVAFNNGKILVPKELSKEIITYAQELNLLRKYGTGHKTVGTQGFPVQVKKAEGNIVENERDENNLIPFTDIEFDDIFLNPIEFDAIIKVTKKLTHMSDYDIEAIVIEELKKAYLRKETYWYFTAPKNPGSLINKAVKFKGTGDNNYLKLVQVKNALPTAMRSKARWMINRAAQTLLESILDNTGNPILKDAGNDDFDYKVLQYPVDVTDYLDGEDPSKPVIYFGDFSYFHYQDVINSLEIEKLTELFARENKVGFKIYHINDGQLIYGPFETPVLGLDLAEATTPPSGE